MMVMVMIRTCWHCCASVVWMDALTFGVDPVLAMLTRQRLGLSRGAIMLVAGREKDGATPSTEETFEKVAACVAKGCLHGGSGDQDAYTRDGVCPETQLPVMHRTEGTGKDETGSRCACDRTCSSIARKRGCLRLLRVDIISLRWIDRAREAYGDAACLPPACPCDSRLAQHFVE